jgi:glycosyltransferase involved in cell wall biosynthesis
MNDQKAFNRVKHVLHVVNVFSDDSKRVAQPFVKSQIQSIRQRGVKVDVFNIRGNEHRKNYFTAFFRLRKVMRKNCFDLVHGHYVYSGIVAASQFRVPSIVSFMGSDINGTLKANGKPQLRGYADIALSHLLEFFIDGIVVKTNRMRKKLFRPSRSILLPNGVDLTVFHPVDQSLARRQLRIDEDPSQKYVLFVGGPSSPVNKGYDIAKKSIEILKEHNPRIQLLTASGVPHNFINYYMNAADVMMLPSLQEGSPNVVKEAMACNLPIVSTDVGDVRELIEGVVGNRVVNRDPYAFAHAILEILKQEKKTDSRDHIEHLRIENISETLIQFYDKLIRKKELL